MVQPCDTVFNQPFKAYVKKEQEKKELRDVEAAKVGDLAKKGIVAPKPTRTQTMEMVGKTNVFGAFHSNAPEFPERRICDAAGARLLTRCAMRNMDG